MKGPSVRERLRATPNAAPVTLAAIDPGATPGCKTKRAAAADLQTLLSDLATRQEQLYAEGRTGGARAVLLVLQGMDCSGKDGTVTHVVGAMNPSGCRIAAFGKPTDVERKHDFLWRIDRELPKAGHVGVFNRSHYEDVGIVKVHALVQDEEIERRYASINRWERRLVERGVRLVKCFLHISKEEQRKRLLARLDDPTKHWKFNPADIDERELWPDYQLAYDAALNRCATDDAPWFVVPADHKWYRNWAVTRLLLETFDDMALRYPAPDLDLPALRARLAD